jgi:ATP-dependent helicase/nuclease subunit B
VNVVSLSPSMSLIEEIARHLTGMDRDYSSNMVVFPGKRPAHFLRKQLAEREASSFVPPTILSMDEFIDCMYETVLGRVGRRLEVIDAVAILYDIHKRSSHLPGRRGVLSPDRFFPVGLKLYSDLEELCIEGIDPRRVKEVETLGPERLPEPTAARLQSLSHFYELFYRTVDERHYSTRSLRYRAVSEHIEQVNLDRLSKIIFAGFFALTLSEKKVFKSLLGRENTHFIFHEGPGLSLPELGVTSNAQAASAEPEVQVYASPDTHGQVFGLSRLLKGWLDQGKKLDEKTVVVVPSPETLFPLYHQTLSLLGPENYNISLGYPLQRTPLFGFYTNLTELVLSMEDGRFYVPYYLDFILHPYTKNIYFQGRSDLTRMLFHAIEEALTQRRTIKFLSLSEIENDGAIAELVQERILKVEPGVSWNMMREHLQAIHENTIQKMLSFGDVGDFAKRLREVVEYIYTNSTARLHPFFYPYSESFVTHLDLVQRSLMRDIRFEEKGSYFTLIKRSLMTAYTPFVGTPLRGVQILGLLETRNITFDRVLFLDVNEGTSPDATREEFFLPFKARQALGLSTYREREKLVTYYFETLIRGAREVHLFYIENDEKVRSRLIEKLLWERQKQEAGNDDRHGVKTLQYAITLQHRKPQPIKKSEAMVDFLTNFSFSATSLDSYLRCPLQFYYRYVLRLQEREAVSDEIEREEIGLLVHQVLHDYFKGKIGRPLTRKDVTPGELREIVRGSFEERYGKNPTGESYLLRRQVETHLNDFLLHYQIPKIEQEPIEIISLEQKLEVVKESFRLRARLDRVEKRGDRTAILDYKTSANKKYLSINFRKLEVKDRDHWPDAIGSLQLPFYLIAYSEATGETPEKIDCLFLLLGRAKIDSAIELPMLEGGGDFGERFGALHHIIFNLLGEIVDLHTPFGPPATSLERCGGCLYEHLCTNCP